MNEAIDAYNQRQICSLNCPVVVVKLPINRVHIVASSDKDSWNEVGRI